MDDKDKVPTCCCKHWVLGLKQSCAVCNLLWPCMACRGSWHVQPIFSSTGVQDGRCKRHYQTMRYFFATWHLSPWDSVKFGLYSGHLRLVLVAFPKSGWRLGEEWHSIVPCQQCTTCVVQLVRASIKLQIKQGRPRQWERNLIPLSTSLTGPQLFKLHVNGIQNGHKMTGVNSWQFLSLSEVEEREATDGQEAGTILEVVKHVCKKQKDWDDLMVQNIILCFSRSFYNEDCLYSALFSFVTCPWLRKSGYKCDGKVVLPVEVGPSASNIPSMYHSRRPDEWGRGCSIREGSWGGHFKTRFSWPRLSPSNCHITEVDQKTDQWQPIVCKCAGKLHEIIKPYSIV